VRKTSGEEGGREGRIGLKKTDVYSVPDGARCTEREKSTIGTRRGGREGKDDNRASKEKDNLRKEETRGADPINGTSYHRAKTS